MNVMLDTRMEEINIGDEDFSATSAAMQGLLHQTRDEGLLRGAPTGPAHHQSGLKSYQQQLTCKIVALQDQQHALSPRGRGLVLCSVALAAQVLTTLPPCHHGIDHTPVSRPPSHVLSCHRRQQPHHVRSLARDCLHDRAAAGGQTGTRRHRPVAC